MATTIRTDPATLNESTLEANITSEIASLFNSPLNFGFSNRLRWLFGFHRVNFGSFRKRKTKIYRLTPIEENSGGGWDSKIVIPRANMDSRAIFIQFKRGEHSEGNSVPNSLFNITVRNPNKHADFTFNDNRGNNQHETLKILSDSLQNKGVSPDSVMYAFPRITTLKQFDILQEDMLLYTSFLTLPEIDKQASSSRVNLYDSQVHHFRTCYVDELKREISSDPFQLKSTGDFENVIYEIVLVKLSHLRNQFRKELPLEVVNNELFLTLADYLMIDPTGTDEFLDTPVRPYEELRSYFKGRVQERNSNFSEMFGETSLVQDAFSWRNRLFNKVVKFFLENQNALIDIQSEVPSQYSIKFSDEIPSQLAFNSSDQISLIVF